MAGSGYAATDKRLSPCERSRSTTAAAFPCGTSPSRWSAALSPCTRSNPRPASRGPHRIP